MYFTNLSLWYIFFRLGGPEIRHLSTGGMSVNTCRATPPPPGGARHATGVGGGCCIV